MSNDPTPEIVTIVEVGAHPAASRYTTLKTTDVAGVPEPGFARPFVSCGASCEAPVQEAACTGAARGRNTTVMPAARARRARFIVTIP
jgi:hypothetical protein